MNNSPQPYDSVIITNYFPRKLALIYKRFQYEAGKVDKRQAITELNTFVEQMLKFLVIYLSIEKLAFKGANAHEHQIAFRNYLLRRPTIGKSIEYLRSFKGDSETGLLYKSFLSAPRSQFLQVVGSFNYDSIGRHGGSLDEESAFALFNKHAESVTKALENLRPFKEFPLTGTTNEGRKISLCGVSSMPAETQNDSAAINHNGSEYLSLWPFILIDSSSHTVALNLNDISRTEDGNKRAIYVGASTNETHDLAMSDKDELAKRIFTALNDKLGHLVDGPEITPLDTFSDYEEKIRDFSGRCWLFNDIKTFIETPVQSLFLIVGQPGTGKSTFMKKFPQLRDECQATDLDLSVSAQFFFTHDRMDRYTVERCLHHILAELEKNTSIRLRSKSENEPHSEPERILYRLEHFFPQIQKDDESYKYLPIPIFIDGVDELRPGEINPFVEAVNSLRTIPNIKLVITSRDIDELQNLHEPDQRLQLEKDPRHRADLFNYAQFRLAVLGWEDQFVRELIEKTDGIFLYLTCVINDFRNGLMTKEEIGSLPSGLEGYYESILKHRLPARFEHRRIGWNGLGFKILKLICIAQRPFNRKQLANFCDRSIRQVQQALDLMQELLICDGEDGGYKFFHLSIQEFIKSRYKGELTEAHGWIVDYYVACLKDGRDDRIDEYFCFHGYSHLSCTAHHDSYDYVMTNRLFHRKRLDFLRSGSAHVPQEWWHYGSFYGPSANAVLWRYLFLTIDKNSPNLRVLLLRMVKFYPVCLAFAISGACFDPDDEIERFMPFLVLALATKYPRRAATLACFLDPEIAPVIKAILNDMAGADFRLSDHDRETIQKFEQKWDWHQNTEYLWHPSSLLGIRDLLLIAIKSPRSCWPNLFDESDATEVAGTDIRERLGDEDEDQPAFVIGEDGNVEIGPDVSMELIIRIPCLRFLYEVEYFLALYAGAVWDDRRQLRERVKREFEQFRKSYSKDAVEIIIDGKSVFVRWGKIRPHFEKIESFLRHFERGERLEFFLDFPDPLIVANTFVYEKIIKSQDSKFDGFKAKLLDHLLPDNECRSSSADDLVKRRIAFSEALRKCQAYDEELRRKQEEDPELLEWGRISEYKRLNPPPPEPQYKYWPEIDVDVDLRDDGDFYVDRMCQKDSEFKDELLYNRTASENGDVALRILTEEVGLNPVSQDLRKQLFETLSMALKYGFNTNQLINKMLEVIEKNIPSPK